MTLHRTLERAWRADGGAAISVWLRPFTAVYRLGRAFHRALYRFGLRTRIELPACVVSVGNLVAGGVGKTPFCAWLAQALLERGHEVLILARGYGREAGARLNDEGQWLAARLPRVRVVQDRDRARAGAAALSDRPADIVLLDDGLQHERLARDLEIVLIDVTSPFGNGRLLPAGPLRETPAALRRADFVVATRCEQAAAGAAQDLEERVRRLAPAARFLASRFPIVALRRGDERLPADSLSGRDVVLWTAVGSPAAVERTLASLGACVVARQLHPDHHRFTGADAAAARKLSKTARAPLVITAKDAVKVERLAGLEVDCFVLEQGVEVADGSRLLQAIEGRLAARRRPPGSPDGSRSAALVGRTAGA
jgi:tetraacyldisaccharide 4'-kinase